MDKLVFSYVNCYKRKGSTLIDTVVQTLLILIILLAPLTFGSVSHTWTFAIEMIAVCCFTLWLMKLFLLGDPKEIAAFRRIHQDQKRGAPHLSYRSFFGYPVKNTGLEVPVLIFLVFLLIQIIPLPAPVVGLISPFSHALYDSASQAAGMRPFFHPLSLDSFATGSRFLLYTAYFMIYVSAVNTLRRRSFYFIIVYAIIVSAIFQSVYGLYELFSGSQHIFWYKKQYFLNCATGTFINRNHYSAYIGLSIPMMMALILTQITGRKAKGGNVPVRGWRLLDLKGGFVLFLSFLLVILLMGAVFSLSLTGLSAIVLSCVGFMYFYARIQRMRRTFWMVALASIVTVGATIAMPQLRERMLGISAEVVSERSRFIVWKDTFGIFLRFPITGSGVGTFPEIFPVYRTFGTTTTYSTAHNEYVQLLSEAGIFAALLFLILFGVVFLRLRRTLLSSPSRLVLLQSGAFSALMMLALHNLVDFSFEVPAVALTGVTVTALAFGSYREEQQNH